MSNPMQTLYALFIVISIIHPWAEVSAQCVNETVAFDDGFVGTLYPNNTLETCVGTNTTQTCINDFSMANTTAYEEACIEAGGNIARYDSWLNCSNIGLNLQALNDVLCFANSCTLNEQGVEDVMRGLISVGTEIFDDCNIVVTNVDSGTNDDPGSCGNETVAFDDGFVGTLYPNTMETCNETNTSQTCISDVSMADTTAYEEACMEAGGIIARYDMWVNCSSVGLYLQALNDVLCFGNSCALTEQSVEDVMRGLLSGGTDNFDACNIVVTNVDSGTIVDSGTNGTIGDSGTKGNSGTKDSSDCIRSRSWTVLSILFIGLALVLAH